MRPSVITPVELTGSRPFARSIVVTVSMPRPEKTGGRRTSRHCTSACAGCLPRWYVGSHAFTCDDARKALLRAVAATALAHENGVTHGASIGSDCDVKTLTVLPIWCAATYTTWGVVGLSHV